MRLTFLFLPFFFWSLATHAAEPIAGQATVKDGDTIGIHGASIRFDGIDAPESSQVCTKDGKKWLCGGAAAFALADFINGKVVRCTQTDRHFKRIVAICYVGEVELNRWLVAEGWALDFKKYSKGRYKVSENEACRERRGLWQSTFEPPGCYRDRVRKRIPRAGCPRIIEPGECH